jgi:methionyl-tRNA formyltransferase
MQVDEGLDTGDILATARCPIDAEETASELDARLARLGAGLLLARLPAILAGSLTPRAQEETQATYARKLTKTEAALDWTRPAADLQRRVLAFNPWPVAQTSLDGKLLRLWRARALDEPARRPPGSVLRAGKGGIDVATGGGVLRLLEVQAAGRRVMRAADFANAHRLEGKVLGE